MIRSPMLMLHGASSSRMYVCIYFLIIKNCVYLLNPMLTINTHCTRANPRCIADMYLSARNTYQVLRAYSSPCLTHLRVARSARARRQILSDSYGCKERSYVASCLSHLFKTLSSLISKTNRHSSIELPESSEH